MNQHLILATSIILHQPWLVFLWFLLNNIREVLILPLLVITSAYLQSRLRTRLSVENDGSRRCAARVAAVRPGGPTGAGGADQSAEALSLHSPIRVVHKALR